MNTKKFIFNVLRYIFLFILVSCGGGGGSESVEQPSIFNPVINTFTHHQIQ